MLLLRLCTGSLRSTIFPKALLPVPPATGAGVPALGKVGGRCRKKAGAGTGRRESGLGRRQGEAITRVLDGS